MARLVPLLLSTAAVAALGVSPSTVLADDATAAEGWGVPAHEVFQAPADEDFGDQEADEAAPDPSEDSDPAASDDDDTNEEADESPSSDTDEEDAAEVSADEDSPSSGDGATSAPQGTRGRGRSAAVRTRNAVMRALRRHGLRTVHATFASPGAGRVVVTVSKAGARVGHAERSVGRGTSKLTVKPTGSAARKAARSKRPKLVVTVRYAPRGGKAVVVTGRVTAR